MLFMSIILFMFFSQEKKEVMVQFDFRYYVLLATVDVYNIFSGTLQ